MGWSSIRSWAVAACVVFGAAYGAMVSLTGSIDFDAPAAAQSGGNVPGNVKGNLSDAEMWRAVRKGITGDVTIPDKKAGQLVQPHGDSLRAFRNGPLSNFGGWILLAVVVILTVFYAFRGKIKIEAGPSGRTVERFNGVERFTHWLTASSFILLAVTGLNVLYGRYILIPIIGQPAFAAIAYYGKLAHNFLGFSFMVGLVMMLVLWVRHNMPTMVDLQWLAKGGGLFSKGSHPPARRFNAGQKLVFWAVILGGASLSFSGICLMFPFEITPFAKTFAFLNMFGTNLPTQLTPLQETQLSLIWHSLAALVMIAIIIAHIYIGSFGMEGAIDAVGTGQVDLNWAKEHHGLWVKELEAGGKAGGRGAAQQPAE